MSQDEELKRLLELASKYKHVEVKQNETQLHTQLRQFIDTFNIRDGQDKIPAAVVFQHYKDWVFIGKAEHKDRAHVKSGKFYRQFASIFKSYCSNGERGYYLDGTPFDLSAENRLRARRNIRNNVQRQRSKKFKKKSSKISGS